MAQLPTATITATTACTIRETSESVLAEALFTSTLQCSECPGPEHVRHAVAATLRRLSPSGCAAEMAAEFGDHPDTAAARMTWALATIRTVYRTVVDVARDELACAS
jgi:hypothetical protein